jgi:hypothetical protein
MSGLFPKRSKHNNNTSGSLAFIKDKTKILWLITAEKYMIIGSGITLLFTDINTLFSSIKGLF